MCERSDAIRQKREAAGRLSFACEIRDQLRNPATAMHMMDPAFDIDRLLGEIDAKTRR